ncbi:TetR family transcriptional regulator [Leifsonia sp. A12D58]|uniref:TetR family transcriptional regulator n=1 Tax=Leifsonia sp. A12D58 TaxID=3397674 RepID=UPI0039E0E168
MAGQSERTAETRERILSAAAVEFAEHGYAGASISAIAETSGTGKGLVQYHFRAKSDIAAAVIRSVFAVAPFANVLGETPSRGIDAIIGSIRGVGGAFRNDVRVRAAVRLVREYDQINIPLPMPYVGWIARIAGMLNEAADLGEVSPGLDSAREAYHLVANFYGVQEVSSRLTNRDDLMERIEEMMLRSLTVLGVSDVANRLRAGLNQEA